MEYVNKRKVFFFLSSLRYSSFGFNARIFSTIFDKLYNPYSPPPPPRGHFCLRSPIRQEFPFQGVFVIPPTPWNLQDLGQKPTKKKLLACSALKGISQHLNRVIRENTILFAFLHLLHFLVRIGLNRNLLIFLNNLCVY